MPVLAMSDGKVTAITGRAYVRQPDGSLKALHVGDTVQGGTRILTDEDGLVEISSVKGHGMVHPIEPSATVVDKAVAGIEAHDKDAVPAGGLVGGVSGSMEPGLRVDRWSESTGLGTPAYRFDATERAVPEVLNGPPGNYLLMAGAGSNTAQATTTGALTNGQPTLIIGDAVVNEGAGTASVTVTLDHASTSVVKVTYASSGEAPLGYADFVPVSGTLTFAPGQTSQTISVPLLNDNVYEGGERVRLTLSDPSNATIVKGTGVLDIRDDGSGSVPNGVTPDDDRPHVASVTGTVAHVGAALDYLVTFNPPSQFADPQPSQHFSLTNTAISLTLTDGHPVDLTKVTAAYSLDGGASFLPLNIDAQGHVTGLDGQPVFLSAFSPTTPMLVRVFNAQDGEQALGQSWHLTASTQYDAQGVSGEAHYDAPYVLVQQGQPVVEGQYMVFDVVRSYVLDDVTVKLSLPMPDHTSPDQAIPGVDTSTQLQYLDAASGQWLPVPAAADGSSAGQLTFTGDQTVMQVRVATLNDGLPEGTEYVKLHLDVLSGHTANLAADNQTALLDNPAPYLVITGESATEGHPVVFNVMLTHATQSTVSVALALAPGLDDPYTPHSEVATPGVNTGTQLEYLDQGGQWQALPSDGHVTFAPGDTLVQVRVATVDDHVAEGVRYVSLQGTVLEDGVTANASNVNQTAITDADTVPGVIEPIEQQLDSSHAQASGYLAADGASHQPGSHFDRVDSILVDGVVHDYDPVHSELSLTTDLGGQLHIDMNTGAYQYTASSTALSAGGETEHFVFTLHDTGTSGDASATMDIALGAPKQSSTNEVLDLRDVLQGENTAGGTGNLDHYLSFNTSGADTVITVSPHGQLDATSGTPMPGTSTQTIVMQGVDLRTAIGLPDTASNVDVIGHLLKSGQLLVDHA